ncbi:MAG: hypothetical protein JWO89_883 [Verrucomicrobiaceae bacterium]|nr:hypothetical protein [Verrucomicrobiaceae bacterium]MDB6119955.1 hypothetical protein [Verrucomicrobiaceae bacterium]
MKNNVLFGVILIIIGGVLLVYQGFSFTHREKVLDIGPITATADKTETVPIPPIIGWLAVGGGAVLLVSGLRSKN